MTREEAIELLENLKVCKQAHTLFNLEEEAVDMAIEALELRPYGEWIPINEEYKNFGLSGYRCSKCNWGELNNTRRFCSNCGADMRGDDK